MRTWMFGAFLLFALALALPVHANNCAIMTQHGMAPDFDCDGVIDEMDNCPYIPNAQQYDMNRNGIGDACDLLIEEVTVNPDNHVLQGEIAHVTIRLINHYDIGLNDITINARNKDLGIDASQKLSYLPQGEMGTVDFWVIIPKCAKLGTYSLSISASTPQGSAETQTETLVVEKGSVCGTQNSSLDYTVIQVPHEIDLDAGEATILPVNIINLGSKQATYDIAVGDLGPFATWRIDPAPRMTLPAGHSDSVYLYLQTDSRIDAGSRTVEIRVTSGNQTTVIPLTVYVRRYEKAAAPPMVLIFQIIFIILLLALIIAAIVIAMRSSRKRKPDHEHDKYIHIDDLKKGGNGNAAKVTTTKTTKTTKVTPKRTISVENAESKVETYY